MAARLPPPAFRKVQGSWPEPSQRLSLVARPRQSLVKAGMKKGARLSGRTPLTPLLHNEMRTPGLEPGRVTPQDPKA